MKRLKITEGVFSLKPTGNNIDDGYDILCNESHGWGKWVSDAKSASLLDGTTEEVKANAELIADAFNTANETDQLPSEIKQERDELIKLFKSLFENMRTDNEAWFFAEQLINKIEKQ